MSPLIHSASPWAMRPNACAFISATAAGMPARNPATLSGLRASRIVSEQPSGFVSDVAGSGDEDHLVSSQTAVRPPSTWMIAPLM